MIWGLRKVGQVSELSESDNIFGPVHKIAFKIYKDAITDNDITKFLNDWMKTFQVRKITHRMKRS